MPPYASFRVVYLDKIETIRLAMDDHGKQRIRNLRKAWYVLECVEVWP